MQEMKLDSSLILYKKKVKMGHKYKCEKFITIKPVKENLGKKFLWTCFS